MITESVNTMLTNAKQASVMVIGDFCLDVYFDVQSKNAAPSLETGLFNRPASRMRTSLGGAGNLLANLSALGCATIYPIGLIGRDMFGLELKRKFEELSATIAPTMFTQDDDWITPSYIKTILDGVEQERIDTGFENKVAAASLDAILASIEAHIHEVQLVLINQQLAKHIYLPKLIKKLNELAKKYPQILFITDCRDLQSQFFGMLHKLNTHELARELNIQLDPHNAYLHGVELEKLIQQYSQNQKGDAIIVSRGELGAVSYREGKLEYAEGLSLLSELDTVGAGDSFLAGLGLALVGGLSVKEALYVGNLVAAVTVQKLHVTGTCSPQELLSIAENCDFIYNTDALPQLVQLPFSAEIVTPLTQIKKRPPIDYAVFDHDGTISVLREGWEEVMRESMFEAITGGTAHDSATMQAIQNAVDQFITKSTGIQTINQMVMLVTLVKQWGLVPQEAIKSPEAYKAIYNDKLLKHFAARLAGVQSGQLQPEDVTILGSIKFLAELSRAGVKIFLASGTDQADVINEAQLLGYANFFNGGISGSVGDRNNDPKKKILQTILADKNIDKNRVVVFGDGPVEMREARKNGALAIGIMSNEIRRYGWNPEKRERLLRAGADILIADFREYQKIADFLLQREAN